MYSISMDTLLYDLALARCHGIGPQLFLKLRRHFGSSQKALAADPTELRSLGLKSPTVDQLLSPELIDVAGMELQLAQMRGIRILFYEDPEFPALLRQSPHCPICICVQGTMHPGPTAVVGTRRPSPAGLALIPGVCAQIRTTTGALVSGLALGIDRRAHTISLDMDIPNMAILGHGLLQDLDLRGAHLAQRILERGGALISQFSLWAPAERHNFPIRNGVIAGLCSELLLIESQVRGGGMITARLNLAQHRPTYAWTDPSGLCQGGIHLTQHSQAQTLQSWLGQSPGPALQLSPAETQALLHLQLPKNLEQICHELQLNPPQVLTLLSTLELKGLVHSMAGAHYQALYAL